MNEDDIKKLRHSFTNPYKEDMPKFKLNQFGHTILNSEDNNIDVESVEVKIDEFGEIKAEAKNSIFDNPNIVNLFDKIMNDKNHVQEHEELPTHSNPTSIYSELLSELDEMDNTISGPKIIEKRANIQLKNCLNKDCMYALPKDANFCLKCGTAQLAKFCVECGFNFKAEEKFCPDCGTKR